jgi:predicted DNA-binding transcriptional regulator AlpA
LAKKQLTTTGIANKFGVKPVTIHKRVADGSFPQPAETRGRVRYWEVAQVQAWAKANKDIVKGMKERSARRVAA